jgi:carbonic anhydrase
VGWASISYRSNYFADLKGQTPPLLWIGCSDSRSANEIIGAKPGEVFVHRIKYGSPFRYEYAERIRLCS